MDRPGHTRRQILKAAIGGAAGIVLGAPVRRLTAAPAQAASEGAGTLRLSDDLFVVRIPGEANVVAQTGADGVLLVDGGSAARFRCADESRLRPARRRSGSHDLQYALAPRADRLERAAGQGRRDDHRAREHAAVADDRRHLALERAAFQTPAQDRAAEQDLLHDRQARLRRSLRVHPGCGAHRRRSVRVLSAAERARRG